MYEVNSKRTSTEQATILANRLMGYYPSAQASDLRVFLAGMIELLSFYPQAISERSVSAIKGFPARFKFFPSIAEAKEALEEWAKDEERRRDLFKRYDRPILPAISGPPRKSMRDELCERFGIRGIPHGWDAVDVTKAAAKYGSRFPEVVEEMLRTPAPDMPKSAFEKVTAELKAAMDERAGGPT